MVKEPSLEEAKKLHSKRYAPLASEKLTGKRWCVSAGQEGYPESLLVLSDPPDKLYGIGNIHALRDGLSIIGARKATPYGKSAARQFAKLAAQRGIPIVSGGALGCDSEAHKGALEVQGETVVVLGGGCDQIYPQSNAALFQQVIDAGGAVISERHWDFPPLPYTFRARNRIIAGLSRATLIVEAGLPSGTFSTADDALTAGKEVLAILGPITSVTSLGSNRLIYQGATPIIDTESFEDVLVGIYGVLRLQDARTPDQRSWIGDGPLIPSDDPLLRALLANPLRIEQMLSLFDDKDGSSTNNNLVGDSLTEDNYVKDTCAEDVLTQVMVKLAQYERDGLIARFPDGRYGPARV